MMGSSLRNQSFFLGVISASLTWTVIIYLYFSIQQEPSFIIRSQNSSPEVKENSELTGNVYEVEGHSELRPIRNQFHRNGLNDIYEINSEKYARQLEEKIKRKNNKNKELKSIIKKETFSNVSDANEENLSSLGLVKTVHDQEVRDHGYRNHAFNTLISSRLSYHRPIPDTRHVRCKDILYPKSLPSASIVICFFREDKSALLRTIHSVLDRTPDYLLHEIVLVDDTDDVMYHEEVFNFVRGISNKIKLIQTPQREGLIRARVYGANNTTGKVLVFLDSHVEVNVGWLEPLLNRVTEDSTHVVTPIIDVISPDTFQYTGSPLVRGGFNWGLHFKWDSIPAGYFAEKSNFVKPIKSPTMAGGLFAMDRKYFFDLGAYDLGMDVWGGENLEMSFRIWTCGGHLEIIPCSRVGHIFRRRRPYGGPQDSLLRNSLRVAHVWLDEFKEKFFKLHLNARKTDYGNISSRIQLRNDLHCKPFSWYLKKVYPEILAEEQDVKKNDGSPVVGREKKYQPWDKRQRKYLHKWQIQLSGTTLCLESVGHISQKGSKLVLADCKNFQKQMFMQTDKDELVLASLLCLGASERIPRLEKCHEMGGYHEWKVSNQIGVPLYNTAAGLCLAAMDDRLGAAIEMALCSTPRLATWDLVDL